jgi:hypothetical protein
MGRKEEYDKRKAFTSIYYNIIIQKKLVEEETTAGTLYFLALLLSFIGVASLFKPFDLRKEPRTERYIL